MSLNLDIALLKKYDTRGPRYTSYPTALEFDEYYTAKDYADDIANSNHSLIPKPLSIYLHIPFCHSLCYFCGCNKIVTPVEKTDKVEQYLDHLYQEIELKSRLFDRDRLTKQIHFGGGTPNFLTLRQLHETVEVIAKNFHLDLPGQVELSIEIDPRFIDPQHIHSLKSLGFNRFSFGIQDFASEVQQAINRVQSEKKVFDLIQAAQCGDTSVSVDLITGLPHQTVDSFTHTLERIVAHDISRIAVYNFAYMPNKIKAQRLINRATLPSMQTRFEIIQSALTILDDAGYIPIGMDHFARPDDPLAKALLDGSLQRNFQGYTTHASTDLIGMGVSAISQFSGAYSQNHTTLSNYYAAIDKNTAPISKGVTLSDDDKIRSYLIQRIMCQREIRFADLEAQFNINVADYFKQELALLAPFEKDQLLTLNQSGITVSDTGRYFLRNICMVFDTYLHQHQQGKADDNVVRFSRAY